MNAFLNVALQHAARGWHVFPCIGKKPLTTHGFKDARKDPEQIRAWWTKWPDANVAIACGASGIAVFDIDHGLANEAGFALLSSTMNLPETYAVRTGRRDDYGVQVYFSGVVDDVGDFRIQGCNGQIKSRGGYVMAVGSVHPVSGELYQALHGDPDNLAPLPDNVRELKTYRPPVTNGPMEKIPEGAGRHAALTSFAGTLRNRGFDYDATLANLVPANESICAVPVPFEDLEHIAQSICRYPVPDKAPEVTIGKKEERKITDWRERYLTFERVRDAKPIEFLIEGFLALDSITALAAPVGQRKSLIALNVAHALCTGEPLFDYFKVTARPSRVVYLCPEMGLSSFSTRLKQIGLDSHIGQTLFCQTMDEDSIKLTDLDEELPGAVVIIDTLTRFVDGDQNSSEDMSRFAKVIFTLKRRGATVILLHHSIKGASQALTLDSAMRGSTELAAFVTCCWATRLADPDNPYQSPSLLVNVKQRDFESKPFEAACDTTCRMRIVGEPGQIAELKNKADDDAKTVLASILKESPKMGINKMQAALRTAGHKKGVKWVTKMRAAILGTGVSSST
jgi:bifunctional DNA primase/polymerase-like protein/AAA domain-containing protein/primase-like protein